MTVTPKLQGIVVGTLSDIPANLLKRSRTEYNWDEFEVGYHRDFPIEDATKIRGSLASFKKPNKTRGARDFATETVEVKDTTGKVTGKILQVWRLPDPVIAVEETPVTAEANTQEVTDTTPDEQQPVVSENKTSKKK